MDKNTQFGILEPLHLGRICMNVLGLNRGAGQQAEEKDRNGYFNVLHGTVI
jgi:hypothetical protein